MKYTTFVLGALAAVAIQFSASAADLTPPRAKESSDGISKARTGVCNPPARYKECKGKGFSSNVTECCRNTDTCGYGASGYPICMP